MRNLFKHESVKVKGKLKNTDQKNLDKTAKI